MSSNIFILSTLVPTLKQKINNFNLFLKLYKFNIYLAPLDLKWSAELCSLLFFKFPRRDLCDNAWDMNISVHTQI